MLPTRLHLSKLFLGSLLAIGALTATPVHALTTYTYTAPINWWANNYVYWFGNYAALDGSPIKFEFTLAAPIPSGAAIPVTGQILSWSYSGGSSFLKLGSDIAGSSIAASVWVDGSGNIYDQVISLGGPVVIPGLPSPDDVGHTTFTSSLTSYITVYAQETLWSDFTRFSSGYDPYFGYQRHTASLSEGITTPLFSGQWEVKTTEVGPPQSAPESAASALTVVGLFAASAVVQRRRALGSSTVAS